MQPPARKRTKPMTNDEKQYYIRTQGKELVESSSEGEKESNPHASFFPALPQKNKIPKTAQNPFIIVAIATTFPTPRSTPPTIVK